MAFFRSIQICKAGWKKRKSMDISTLVYSSCNDACLRLFCNASVLRCSFHRQAHSVSHDTDRRTSWVVGQLFYIFFTGLLYTIINYILTVICFFPRIEFTTDWGKVIRTLAMNPSSAYQKGIHLTVEINTDIVTTFSAIKATLISLGLFFRLHYL